MAEGAAINGALLEAKANLARLKAQRRALAEEVNLAKLQIDQTKGRLDEKKKERELLHPGTEEAEIIDEEEYSSFQALKEHKAKYKRSHEGLQALAEPFKAASDSVDSLRQELLGHRASVRLGEAPRHVRVHALFARERDQRQRQLEHRREKGVED